MTLPRLEDLERDLVRRHGLIRFIRLGWPQIESVEYIHGWHLEELAIHLEAVTAGEIKRLLINIPPGCMKSLAFSVFWPAWDWIKLPADKYMYASFDPGLSQRDALRTKGLVRSNWFQTRWGFRANQQALKDAGIEPVSISGVDVGQGKGEKEVQDTASIYWTTSGGFRFSTSTQGKATGWHAHKQCIDDPTKPKDIQGGGKKARAALKRSEDWYTGTMSTRKADPNNFVRIITMQRLHSNDLCGLAEATGDYVVLKLPMTRGKAKTMTKWGGDRRENEGELLWPERFNEATVKEGRKELGPQNAAAQYDQSPSSEAGSIIKRVWLEKVWQVIPAFAKWYQFWDLSFDDEEDSSFVAGQTWAHKGEEYFLVDRIKRRMDFPETCLAVRDFAKKWTAVSHIYVEKKANGSALLKQLRKEVPRLMPWEPGTDSKEGRMHSVSGYFEAGNVLMPREEIAPWVLEYKEEITLFPKAPNDDEADCTSMALAKMTGKSTGQGSKLKTAMANVKL